MNVLNIIFIIAGIVAISFGVSRLIARESNFGAMLCVIGIALVFVSQSFAYIPTGYVGIKTQFGQISDKPCSPGLNWKTPFADAIHTVNCKQQEKDFKDLQIWSETSERTEVYCQNVVVDYQVDADYAAWIWSNVEEYDTNLVKQTSVESGIKAATKQYNDVDVCDRSKIEATAKECIQKSLNEKYKNQIVNIVSVTIGNINFSDAYNAAIEKKAQAKLATEAAEYTNKETTQRIEAEAQQRKIKAESDAEAKKIAAQAEADAIKIKASAEAEANKKISESLTDELIELKKIEKWNGKLSKVSGGTPLVNVGVK